MPDVYLDGESIPELRGRIQGGHTAVVHEPNDIDGLRILCATAGRPPEAPFTAIHRELGASGFSLSSWIVWKDRLGSTPADWTETVLEGGLPQAAASTEETPARHVIVDSRTDTRALEATLSLAKEIWTRQGDEMGELALIMSVAGPGKDLEVDLAAPGLSFWPGSILMTLGTVPRRVSGWLVALALTTRSGVQSQVSDEIHEHAQRAVEAAGGRPLGDLAQGDEPTFEKGTKGTVVVFVHGFLSTYVGNFDKLVERAQGTLATPGMGEIWYTGFRHDTLASISANGLNLAHILQNRVLPRARRLAFVCHSRGGLVARSAAARLLDWKAFSRDHMACVTFGTPHEGTRHAEQPESLVAITVVGLTLKATKSVGLPGLVVQMLKRSGQRLDGVEDMRPVEGQGEFLRRLKAREGRVGMVPIRAFGGIPAERGLLYSMLKIALAQTDHDIVIETSSTMPSGLLGRANCQLTTCDHFGYFDQTQTPHFDDAIAFLRSRLA